MHDVSFREGSVLAAQEARVLLVHEQAEMRAQAAMLVAQPLRERWVSAHQGLEGLAQRRRVQRDLARAAGETAVGAVEKYAHMSMTNRRSHSRQPSDDEGASRNSRMRT